MATRGQTLLAADRRFATGGGLIARLAAPAFRHIVDQLHDRLAAGGIHGTLPDGSPRNVGSARGARAVGATRRSARAEKRC